MTTPVLPSQFVPIFGGHSHGGAGGVVRTEVSGGFSRYALAYDRGVQKWNITLQLTDTAYSAWVAFYHYTIKKGAITFTMNLDSGFGLEPHDVNIVPDTYNQNVTEWNTHIVSFTCEGESTVYQMTEEEALALVNLYSIYGEGLSAFLNQLAQFATVDSNVLNF